MDMVDVTQEAVQQALARPRAVRVTEWEEVGIAARSTWVDQYGKEHRVSGSRGSAVMTALRLLKEKQEGEMEVEEAE